MDWRHCGKSITKIILYICWWENIYSYNYKTISIIKFYNCNIWHLSIYREMCVCIYIYEQIWRTHTKIYQNINNNDYLQILDNFSFCLYGCQYSLNIYNKKISFIFRKRRNMWSQKRKTQGKEGVYIMLHLIPKLLEAFQKQKTLKLQTLIRNWEQKSWVHYTRDIKNLGPQFLSEAQPLQLLFIITLLLLESLQLKVVYFHFSLIIYVFMVRDFLIIFLICTCFLFNDLLCMAYMSKLSC